MCPWAPRLQFPPEDQGWSWGLQFTAYKFNLTNGEVATLHFLLSYKLSHNIEKVYIEMFFIVLHNKWETLATENYVCPWESFVHSFLLFIVFIGKAESKRERERREQKSSHLLNHCSRIHNTGSRDSIWGSVCHMGSRDSSTGAITCCFSDCVSAESWNQKWS